MKNLIALLIIIGISIPVVAQQSPCQEQGEYRQLDFWVGDWRVETPAGQVAGHNRIEVILDGCVILENWEGAGASKGKSLNYYDAATKQWHQKWIDNFGRPLEFIGEVTDHSIIYRGTSTASSGNKVLNEMALTKINDDEVRQIWKQSTDEGATWTTVFDGRYLREGKH